MKLITEINESVKILKEEKNGERTYFIEGVFLQADLKNKNGRVYPLSIMEREVQRYVNEYVAKNRAYGELNHPQGPTINLDKVSHMIKEIRQQGTDFYGKAKVLDTPMGKIVKNLIDEGANLGVSSRGIGSLKSMDGADVVQDDFMLATAADIVADPSAPSAFVRGIMEGVEWVKDGDVIKPVQVKEYRKQVDEAYASRDRARKEKIALQLFEDFMKKVSKGGFHK
jgi:hypothetical protein